MKKYLLDTHVFLWSLEKSPFLPLNVIKILEDGTVPVFVSITSLWEIAIKLQIKKLQLPQNIQLQEIILHSGFELLNIKVSHIEKLSTLKFTHRDPFDHLLAAQAKTENLILITHDVIFKKYLTRPNLFVF